MAIANKTVDISKIPIAQCTEFLIDAWNIFVGGSGTKVQL